MNILGMQEDARVEKRDGRVLGPFPATFAGSTIVVADPLADIEEGDTILRTLPGGRDERSVVTEANFFRKGVGPLGAHYQLKFRKGGEAPAQKPAQSINIHGAQSVQIGDYNTQTVINSFDSLIKQIDACSAPATEKEAAKGRLRAFLEHPVVVSVIGAVSTSLLG